MIKMSHPKWVEAIAFKRSHRVPTRVWQMHYLHLSQILQELTWMTTIWTSTLSFLRTRKAGLWTYHRNLHYLAVWVPNLDHLTKHFVGLMLKSGKLHLITRSVSWRSSEHGSLKTYLKATQLSPVT